MNIHLKSEERLSILRAEDQFRRWNSLDDERFCIVCEKRFNGRQIEIRCFTNGKHELHCPTEACHSGPHQWVYPDAPLIPDTTEPDCWDYSPKAGKPLGQMVTIAERRAIDRLRTRQAYFRARERYSKQLEQQPRNRRREAFDPFARSDLRHFLKKWMRTLPRFQCEAVELAFFKGLSQREIATATHTPLGTVKRRLELGLQKLTHAIRPLRNKI